MPVKEIVTEFSSIANKVDRETSTIRGVKLLGLESTNKRTYPRPTIERAGPLYEGVQVNVDHAPDRHTGARSYRDRIGHVRGVIAREDGLYGDLHFNPKHPLMEQILWDAEHATKNVGMSHNVEATLSRRSGKAVVEAINRVVSVDLVTDPATTRGLFEQQKGDSEMDWNTVTKEQVREHCPGVAKALIDEALAERDEGQQTAALKESLDKANAALEAATKERDALKEAEEKRDQRAEAIKALESHTIHEPPDWFVEAYLQADEKTAAAMVEDRKKLTEQSAASRPKSREQHVTEHANTNANGAASGKELASRIGA